MKIWKDTVLLGKTHYFQYSKWKFLNTLHKSNLKYLVSFINVLDECKNFEFFNPKKGLRYILPGYKNCTFIQRINHTDAIHMQTLLTQDGNVVLNTV